MRRVTFLLSLLVAAACSSGDKSSGTVTGVNTVASVTITAPATTIAVGQAVTLSASELDASGNQLSGQTVAWTTSSASVATVTSAGVVTGIAPGQTIITATDQSKSAQTTITVSQAVASCAAVTPLTLTVGQPHTLTATERQLLCVAGGTAGSEYALIAFNDATAGDNIATSALATNTASPAISPSRAPTATPLFLRAPPKRQMVAQSFESHLRAVERTELASRFRALKAARGGSALRSLMNPGPTSRIVGLPATPTVGTIVTLNANGNDACTNPDNRRARVAAVSKQAIVLADSTNPAGGFTDADYLSIATTFDTLVWPLDTTAFSAPTDIDNNGHVILFFTDAVNALTPPSGVDGVVGGFFFSRDLFPPTGGPDIQACATSNFGEMFYLPVVDPAGIFNPYFTDKPTLISDIIGTLAHEFQHLINGSRRVYITNAVDFEVVWLNEGMSHIAEELLYYRTSGFTPKQNLNFATTVTNATAAQFNDLNSYQAQNLGRLAEYVSATDVNSPYAPNDELATRGGTWELLRYCLDQSATPSSTLLHALVNSPDTGKTNFDAVFSGTGGLISSVRNQVIANFFDDTPYSLGGLYTFPSWNYRDLLIRFNGGPSTYQLQAKPLLPGAAQSFSLTPGGSGYMRFRVNSATTGGVAVTAGGGVLPTSVELMLVRMQ